MNVDWGKVRDSARRAVRAVPLFGQLMDVERESLKEAFYETLSTTIFATLPIWFLPFVGPYFNEKSATLADSAHHGEVFIYAAVLLGPLIYVITKRYGRFNIRGGSSEKDDEGFRTGPLSFIFPYGGLFLTICAFVCFLAGYAITRVRAESGAQASAGDQSGIETLSLVIFFATTILFFLICAYRNMLDDKLKTAVRDIVRRQPTEEKDFTNLWLRTKS